MIGRIIEGWAELDKANSDCMVDGNKVLAGILTTLLAVFRVISSTC